MRPVVILLGLQLLGSAQAGTLRPSKIAEDLRLEEGDEHDVIVLYSRQPEERQQSRVRTLGGKLRRSLPLVNGVQYQLTTGQLQQLALDPDVESIQPNREVRGTRIGIAIIGSGISQSLLINLKVLNEDGSGTDANVIAAITRAVQLKAQYNIRVINLSMERPGGGSYKTDPLCLAVEAAWKAGIAVVVEVSHCETGHVTGQNNF